MRLRKQRMVMTGAVAALALVGAGCAADEEEGGGSGSGATIGTSVDLTAYLASFDRGVDEGVKLAADQINEGGGVLGGDIEVISEDMKADPQQGVRAFQRLVDQEQADVIVNGFSSAATEAVAPTAESQETPIVASSVIPEDAEWEFSTLPPPEFETGVRMEYLEREGIESVGVLKDATPYNEAQLATLEAQAEEFGIEITDVVQHDSDAVDLRPQITSLLNGDPEAIMKLSAGPTHVLAARALAAADADVPLLFSIENLSTVRQAAAAYPETFLAAAPPQVYESLRPEERSEELDTLVEIAPQGEDLTYIGRGYDAALLFAEALRRAETTEGEAVRTALEELPPFEGTSGVYDFTADNHYGLSSNPLYLAKVPAGDGDPQIVYRPERGE